MMKTADTMLTPPRKQNTEAGDRLKHALCNRSLYLKSLPLFSLLFCSYSSFFVFWLFDCLGLVIFKAFSFSFVYF